MIMNPWMAMSGKITTVPISSGCPRTQPHAADQRQRDERSFYEHQQKALGNTYWLKIRIMPRSRKRFSASPF